MRRPALTGKPPPIPKDHHMLRSIVPHTPSGDATPVINLADRRPQAALNRTVNHGKGFTRWAVTGLYGAVSLAVVFPPPLGCPDVLTSRDGRVFQPEAVLIHRAQPKGNQRTKVGCDMLDVCYGGGFWHQDAMDICAEWVQGNHDVGWLYAQLERLYFGHLGGIGGVE